MSIFVKEAMNCTTVRKEMDGTELESTLKAQDALKSNNLKQQTDNSYTNKYRNEPKESDRGITH